MQLPNQLQNILPNHLQIPNQLLNIIPNHFQSPDQLQSGLHHNHKRSQSHFTPWFDTNQQPTSEQLQLQYNPMFMHQEVPNRAPNPQLPPSAPPPIIPHHHRLHPSQPTAPHPPATVLDHDSMLDHETVIVSHDEIAELKSKYKNKMNELMQENQSLIDKYKVLQNKELNV